MSIVWNCYLSLVYILILLFGSQVVGGVAYDCFGKGSQPHSLLNVRVGIHPHKTRLVIDLTGKIAYKASQDLAKTKHEIILEGVISKPDFFKLHKGQGLIQNFTFESKDTRTVKLYIKTRKISYIRKIFLIARTGKLFDRLVIDFANASNHGEKNSVFHSETSSQFINDKPLKIPNKNTFVPLPQHKPVKRTVVIDAGHGGQDPGTVGPGKLFEKHITLNMAREIKRQIEKNGHHRAVLTREKDEFIRLRRRFARAREVKADLFISLHADSHPNKKIRGLSVYTLSDHASDQEAAILASKENKADVIAGFTFENEPPDVANILIDLTQSNTRNLSVNFAQEVLECIAKDQKLSQNTHRYADFAVLKAPDVPSVLIELGYLSNPIDTKRLLQKKYQKAFASDIVKAIDRYFQKLKR
jgi:N-acetylmuramoyl-L-alanine amidase